jgi:hypothetical protein
MQVREVDDESIADAHANQRARVDAMASVEISNARHALLRRTVRI